MSPRYGTAQARAKLQLTLFTSSWTEAPHNPRNHLQGESRSLPDTGKRGELWSNPVFTHSSGGGVWIYTFPCRPGQLMPATWQECQSSCAQQLHVEGWITEHSAPPPESGFTQAGVLLTSKAMPDVQVHSLVQLLNSKYILCLKKPKIFTCKIIT